MTIARSRDFIHGREYGVTQHRRRGEDPCAACAEAARVAKQRRRARIEAGRVEVRRLDADFRWDVHRRHPEWFGAVAS